MKSETVNVNLELKKFFNTIHTYLSEKYLTVCKWIGTASTIIGALLTSCGYDPENIIAFNLGAVFWLLASIRMKDAPLMAVNAGLLGIYAVGAIVRFF